MKTRFFATAVATLGAALLSACGGGGNSPSTAATTTVAGTISGLGSVVLNGVRYETIGASVVDADSDSAFTDPLGMGMTVSIEPLSSNASAAGTIQVQGGLQGSASAVDANTLTLLVAGLPVSTDASTFIVTASAQVGRFADLADNQGLEVYGLPQSDGSFKATRIEIKASAPVVELVGLVSNLNTANSTFTLGSTSHSVSVSYAAAQAPTGLANGAVVSVHTATSSSAASYAATRLYLRSGQVSTFTRYASDYGGTSGVAREANELYGMVSALSASGAGCTLQVQGVPTTLSSASLCAAIQNGDYVEVKGVLANGALAASRLEFKTAGTDRSLSNYQDDANDSDQDGLKYSRHLDASSSGSSQAEYSAASYELYGTLSNCSASTCTLTSNGVALVADLSTALWEHGQVSSGWVEAKGYMSSASTFKVTKIEAKQ